MECYGQMHITIFIFKSITVMVNICMNYILKFSIPHYPRSYYKLKWIFLFFKVNSVLLKALIYEQSSKFFISLI